MGAPVVSVRFLRFLRFIALFLSSSPEVRPIAGWNGSVLPLDWVECAMKGRKRANLPLRWWLWPMTGRKESVLPLDWAECAMKGRIGQVLPLEWGQRAGDEQRRRRLRRRWRGEGYSDMLGTRRGMGNWPKPKRCWALRPRNFAFSSSVRMPWLLRRKS